MVARDSSSEVLKFWASMRCAPLSRPRQRPFSKPLQVASMESWLQVVLEVRIKLELTILKLMVNNLTGLLILLFVITLNLLNLFSG